MLDLITIPVVVEAVAEAQGPLSQMMVAMAEATEQNHTQSVVAVADMTTLL